MILETLPGEYAIARYAPKGTPPQSVWQQPFVAAVRTPDELLLVCPADVCPEGAQTVTRGWSALRVAGPLDFSLTGVLAGLSGALAAAGVSVFAVSTFDTDYLLVRSADLPQAVEALLQAGYTVDGKTRAVSADDRARIRRRERAVADDEWIIARLRAAEYGVLATCVDGQPFTVARNFVYNADRHCLYLHGARKGRTYETVQPGARANFNVSQMGRLLPAEAALEMSVEYAGVVIFGRLSLVEDPDEAKVALQQLVEKYFPHLQVGRDYIPVRDVDLQVTAVLRLDIEAWSGKQKQAPEDFPGAFRFGEQV